MLGTYGEYGDEIQQDIIKEQPKSEQIVLPEQIATSEYINKIQFDEMINRKKRIEKELDEIQRSEQEKIKEDILPPPIPLKYDNKNKFFINKNNGNKKITMSFKEFNMLTQMAKIRGITFGVLIGIVIGIGGTLIYFVNTT